MRNAAQLAVYVPSFRMVRHTQAHAFVLLRTGNERVRVQEREGLAELTFRIAFELLSTHRERFKEARHSDGRASLRYRVRMAEAVWLE